MSPCAHANTTTTPLHYRTHRIPPHTHTPRSLENSDGFTRNNFNAIVSPYALATTYLPAFRAAITTGNAQGIMCSYK